MTVITPRRKILGIGYPRFAVAEWEALAAEYDIHHFVPGDRKQVVSEVKRLCDEHGPFDAGYVLFGTAAYSPFHADMLGPLLDPGTCGLWAQGGAGYDDVDVAFITGSNAWFSNTPHSVTAATADMGILLMLSALRGLSQAERTVRAGKWRDDMPLTDDPEGKTIGFLGLGAIGKSMAMKTKPWDMKVLYHNRNRLPEAEEQALGATFVSFDELLAKSDIISVNCPLTDKTRGILSTNEFAKMKDGVFIVNTARGAVIDEDALIAALKSGKVARAGLDVLTTEPCRDSWLFASDRVTLQPHLGAFTTGTILKGERAVLGNVKAYLETGVPVTPVNKPERAAKA
ncbi:hypothetical protein Q5752_004212 [Cryptotrichosporon argae]